MHRIAAKIGIATSLAAGAAGLFAATFGSASLTYPIITALVAGLAAFAISHRQIGRRLRRIEMGLDALRGEGGRVDDMQSKEGDEIDSLLRRADQTVVSVRKQIADMSTTETFRREYLGDVSHELKTPIFAIQGFAETLIAGALEDDEVRRGFTEKILQNTERLRALAENLTEISRLESGAFQLVATQIDLRRLFAEVRESHEVCASRKQIELQIAVAPEAETVTGDRECIRRVLSNLVDNAVKYSDPGGWVRLNAEMTTPGTVRLAVQDRGIGIAANDLSRITERFYRAEKSRSRGRGGTGLGLSIVKHILAAHETTINIGSTVGQGSTFAFTLPVAPPNEATSRPGSLHVA